MAQKACHRHALKLISPDIHWTHNYLFPLKISNLSGNQAWNKIMHPAVHLIIYICTRKKSELWHRINSSGFLEVRKFSFENVGLVGGLGCLVGFFSFICKRGIHWIWALDQKILRLKGGSQLSSLVLSLTINGLFALFLEDMPMQTIVCAGKPRSKCI